MTSTQRSSATIGPVGATAHGVVQGAASATLDPGFHAALADRNRAHTIPHGIRMLEETGNLRNLRRLTGEQAPFTGPVFADSDVYKTLEAVAWELGHAATPELQQFYDHTVALLEAAQRDDGYLDSAFQLGGRFGEPWSDFAHGHELYCLGHLIQAAVAGSRALGDERLLAVAQRFVDHVFRRFGDAASPVYCGHPEIETALIELHRLTGNGAARQLAEAFVARRGAGFIGDATFGAQYYQDDVSVLETSMMRGHAVRAMYLNAGVADVYLESGDERLLDALRRQWDDLVARRLYITGGTGSRHKDEAFGDAYELPSDRAYAETCAGIALVNWAWRMYLAEGSSGYLDVLERTLYNVVLAGISRSGTRFFYSNPLQLRSDHGASQQESAGSRLDWYWCACCPPNLMRVIATLEHMMFAERDGEIQVAGYGNASLALHDGASIRMRSDFPASGRVRIEVVGEPGDVSLAIRVPDWAAKSVDLRIDGEARESAPDAGWLRVGGIRAGTVIEIEFGMEPIAWRPHPGIDALRGSVAITRGPLVYCADQCDNTLDIERLSIRESESVQAAEVLDGFGPLLRVDAVELESPPFGLPLYVRTCEPTPLSRPAAAPLVLRPYATWGNGPSPQPMRVWLPTGV